MLQLPILNVVAKLDTTAISRTIDVHAPAGYLSCRHNKLTQLYENFTYTPHAAHGYRVKLQR